MITEITKAQLLTFRLGQLRNEGKATSAQISMAKRNNVEIALDIAREARQIHGGMGISLLSSQSFQPTNQFEMVSVGYCMKLMLLFVIVLISLTACKKDKIEISGSANEIIGEYEWYCSTSGVNDSFYQDQTTDRYGIRIDEKSKFKFFINGEIYQKGYVSNYRRNSLDNGWIITIQGKWGSERLNFIDGEIQCDRWPQWGYSNKWLKK